MYAIGALLYFMSRGDAPGSVPEYRNEPEYRMFDRIIRGCMEKEKEARYQSADELQETLQELQNQLKEQAAESRIVVFAGAAAGIGTTHAALGMSHFLTRNGCPALYQEAYDTSAVRTLAKNMGIKTDRTGVYRIGCGSIRPYYGDAVKLPYLYFPVIIKDVGVIRPEEKLPEADFYVLVCGGKWWEIDRTVNAAKILKSRGNVILLFNHMEKKARLKLPKVLSDIHYFFLPFFQIHSEKIKLPTPVTGIYGTMVQGKPDGKEKNYHRDSGEAMQNDRNRWEQYRGGVHPFFDHADKLSRGIPQKESHTAGI